MLYIMRHGQTDWNLKSKATGAEDVPLNDTGWSQARDAAEKLASFGIIRIVSSDLTRTAGTADTIGMRLGITVEYDPRLREWDFGEIKGMKEIGLNPESFKKLLAENQNSGMEPVENVFMRIGTFLAELDMKPNTLIVSHGGLIRAMMYYIQADGKVNSEEFLKFSFATQVKNAQIFKLSNNGIFEPVR